jgi:hypothetical protein
VSYLHCPRCQHAYNIAVQSACPSCVTDPTDDVVAAADQLARAIERATPAQLAAAEARLDQKRLGDGGSRGGSILRALRAAVPVPSPHPAILATVALALITRLTPPRRTIATWSSRARALLARF